MEYGCCFFKTKILLNFERIILKNGKKFLCLFPKAYRSFKHLEICVSENQLTFDRDCGVSIKSEVKLKKMKTQMEDQSYTENSFFVRKKVKIRKLRKN